MSNRIITVGSFLALAILLVMLNFTTPTGIGPFGVLLFFMLVYVVMFGVATGVVYLIKKTVTRRTVELGRKDRMCAVLVAFAPIMLLLAQSMGSMGVLTLVLVAIFVALGSFFIYKKA